MGMKDDESEYLVSNHAGKDGDYVESRTYCYCLPLKVGVYIICAVIWIDFVLHIVVTAQNYENESFDFYYNIVYTIMVVVFGIGALLAAVFVFGPEGHTSR